MRSLGLFLPLAFLGGVQEGPGGHSKTLTREEMQEDLAQFADVARRCWAYEEDKREQFGIDLEALERAFRIRLEGIRTRGEFTEILREFVSSLQDGHCGIWIPDPRRKAAVAGPST